MGMLCDKPCPAGYYGKNCAKKCSCQNRGSCDRVNGMCSCVGEWQGDLCELSGYLNFK